MNKRVSYYDNLRGLAIIGVIAIHSAWIVYGFNPSSIDFIGTVIWRQIVNFSVPIFLALSGFFLANKDLSTMGKYKDFIKNQIQRIFFPFLVWSIFYSIIKLQTGASLNTIIFNFFTFQAIVPFYFILLIIQFYILLPLIQKMANFKGLIISTIISLLSCLIIFYFNFYTNISLPFIIYAGGFYTWVVFFVLGIYLRIQTIKINNNLLLLLTLVLLTFSLIETFLIYKKTNNILVAADAIKVTSFLYSISFIIWAFSNVRNKKYTLLTYIGEVSFGVYLSHLLFLHLTLVILNKVFPFLSYFGIVKQIILIILTLASSLLFSFISRKINRKFSIKYLGQ